MGNVISDEDSQHHQRELHSATGTYDRNLTSASVKISKKSDDSSTSFSRHDNDVTNMDSKIECQTDSQHYQQICKRNKQSKKKDTSDKLSKNKSESENQVVDDFPDEHAKLRILWNKKWLLRFKELKKFHRKFGHCNVPKTYKENKHLGSWVQSQRFKYRTSQIEIERQKQLEEIGFEWDVSTSAFASTHVSIMTKSDAKPKLTKRSEEQWKTRYKELKEFQRQNGHCNVPQKYEKNIQLGRWVSDQRNLGKTSRLKADRKEKLEKIGFRWIARSVGAYVYDEKASIKIHNNPSDLVVGCRIAVYWPDDAKYYNSVIQSREGTTTFQLLYDDHMTETIDLQQEKYKVLSWPMKVNNKTRKRKFGESENLQDHEVEHEVEHEHEHEEEEEEEEEEDLMSEDEDDIETMEEEKRMLQTELNEIKIEALKALNKALEKQLKKWFRRYIELLEFKMEYGHCNVPLSYEQNMSLGRWLGRQRLYYRLLMEGKPSSITKERVERLNKIGFEWKMVKSWDERFLELIEFKKRYGHCNVPSTFEPNIALGLWVTRQRQLQKGKGKSYQLTPDRIKRLEQIGFQWNYAYKTRREKDMMLGDYKKHTFAPILDKKYDTKYEIEIAPLPKEKKNNNMWHKRYQELIKFKKQYGHCNVPHSSKQYKKLGLWVAYQRKNYKSTAEGKSSLMPKERVELLEKIGFTWILCTWRLRYDELVDYNILHGHCNVPYHYQHNITLGRWVHRQRQHYAQMIKGESSPLTNKQINKLEKIGFEWDST